MIENNPTNVQAAFEMLLEEIEAEIVLRQLQDNSCYALITGDGLGPGTQEYCDAVGTHKDDNFMPSDTAVFNNQGNVTIGVSRDGGRYTVVSDSFVKTVSAIDSDNVHGPQSVSISSSVDELSLCRELRAVRQAITWRWFSHECR